MRNDKQSRVPRASLIVSVLALVVAMSGAAVAAKQELSSKYIKDNSVKSVDLKDGKAVSGDDVVDESLSGADVAPDSLLADDLAPDSAGSSELAPNSADSSEIADNAVGASELAAGSVGSAEIANGQVRGPDLGPTVLRSDAFTVGAGSSGAGFVNCQAGETRISGGAIAPAINGSFLQASWPNGANGWTAFVRNNTAADFNAVAYALCLQA